MGEGEALLLSEARPLALALWDPEPMAAIEGEGECEMG